jgi:hypothetical protein
MQNSKIEYRKIHELGSGRSSGICIPKRFLKDLSLLSGDFVRLSQEENRIIIQKIV